MKTNVKFMAVNTPKSDYVGQSVHPDYLYKNLAIVADNQATLCEVNADALKDALLNSPELLHIWKLKLVPEQEPTNTKKATGKDGTK